MKKQASESFSHSLKQFVRKDWFIQEDTLDWFYEQSIIPSTDLFKNAHSSKNETTEWVIQLDKQFFQKLCRVRNKAEKHSFVTLFGTTVLSLK